MKDKLCCVLNCAASCSYCGWKRCTSCMIGRLQAYGSHWQQATKCPRHLELNKSEGVKLDIHDAELKRFYGDKF